MRYNREQGNIDFLTTGKTLMCKREKGLSDNKILAKYYNFSHFSVKPMKITNHEKIKYESNWREQREIFLAIKGTWSGISGNRGTQ